jgi:broad specificity phosphatase PhoE
MLRAALLFAFISTIRILIEIVFVSSSAQAADVASKLVGFSVDCVVSSPFRRCLQTSAGVVKQLGLQQGQWLVDWQLSEVR